MNDLTPETPTKFVFDWQDAPEGFMKWFLPTVMVDVSREQMDELAGVTSLWRRVHLQVLINGVEVNAGHFLESVERSMNHQAALAARKLLDSVGGLDALEERIGEIRTHLVEQFEVALRERGIELPEREEW